MENDNKTNRPDDFADNLARINEGYRYLDIYRSIESLITSEGILIDMGHGKNLQFPARLAQTITRHFPKKEMVYYDRSDPEVIRGWFNSLKQQIRKGSKRNTKKLAIKAKQIVKELPDTIKWIDSPSEYIGKASEVCLFFTKHHFENPKEALKEAYDLLRPEETKRIYGSDGNIISREVSRPGGIVVVIDYDLKRTIQEMDREQAEEYVGKRFNTASEKEVKRTEPNWFKAHTREGLEDCVREMTEIGFNVIEREVYENKVFSCVGRKTH